MKRRPPGRHEPVAQFYYDIFDNLAVGGIFLFQRGRDRRPSHGFFHNRALKFGWTIKQRTLENYLLILRKT